jgi:hypothetical protein
MAVYSALNRASSEDLARSYLSYEKCSLLPASWLRMTVACTLPIVSCLSVLRFVLGRCIVSALSPLYASDHLRKDANLILPMPSFSTSFVETLKHGVKRQGSAPFSSGKSGVSLIVMNLYSYAFLLRQQGHCIDYSNSTLVACHKYTLDHQVTRP